MSRQGISMVILAALVLFSSLPADLRGGETAGTTRPALIGDHADSLLHALRFPETDRSEINTTVHCSSLALKSGKLRGLQCSGTGDDREFIQVVHTAVSEGAGVTPAILKGNAVKVWFQFTVHFMKIQGQTRIRICQNMDEHPGLSSSAYISPQQVVMYDSYTERQAVRCGPGSLYLANIRVDEHGNPGTFELLEVIDSGGIRCPGALENIALHSDYIPGQVQGRPVAMNYLHYFSMVREMYMYSITVIEPLDDNI